MSLLWTIFLSPSIQNLSSPQTLPRLLILNEMLSAEQLAVCLIADQVLASLVLLHTV